MARPEKQPRTRVAVAIGAYPAAERQRRVDAALSFQSADTEVGIVDVPATPYVKKRRIA